MDAVPCAPTLAGPFSIQPHGFSYGVPGGERGTVGKEKAIPVVCVPAWGKMRCRLFKARYPEHNSWINPVK